MSAIGFTPVNVIRVIKSKRMRSMGHLARVGEARNSHKILVRKSEPIFGISVFGRTNRIHLGQGRVR